MNLKRFLNNSKDNMSASKNKFEEFISKKYKKRRYYTPNDVGAHFQSGDIWVTLFGNVFDLTLLIQENITSPLCKPLLNYAGKDITHFFDKHTKEPLTKIDTKTGRKVFHCPEGRFLHVPNQSPNSFSEPTPEDQPWWRNHEKYVVGKLTQKVRKLRIVNMLTHQENIIEVPKEETIEEIQERYLNVNEHAASYTWKTVTQKPLDMEGTLDENEIFDETDNFEDLGIPEDEWYIPPILIFFDDDLTEG
jgi:hypothetical protein